MKEKRRRTIAVILLAVLSAVFIFNINSAQAPPVAYKQTVEQPQSGAINVLAALERVEVKGRAPKTGYTRAQFLSDWGEAGGCDLRNLILQRDLSDTFVDPVGKCVVIRGRLDDPYTGKVIEFKRGQGTSDAVQIDHVVALSDAWQKGAQQLGFDVRNRFGNDPLNLLAVDGPANQNKSDADAATWLPANKGYRCRYVARQTAVKLKYHLWMTAAEKDAIKLQLRRCPDQVLPIEGGKP